MTYQTLYFDEFIQLNRDEYKKAYLSTAWGMEEVTSLRLFPNDPWVVCGKANAGFGISYAVHNGTLIYLEI